MNIDELKRLCPEFAEKSELTIARITQISKGIPLADPGCYAEMKQVVLELTQALAEARQALESQKEIQELLNRLASIRADAYDVDGSIKSQEKLWPTIEQLADKGTHTARQ